jgi:hypothetical protein
MKKVLSILMAVALLSGCAGFLKFSQEVQQILCNPPTEVVQVANAAAPLIATILNMAVPGSETYVTAASAANTVTAIQQGLCVGATQVSSLISFLSSDTAKVAAETQKAPRINVQPLIDWLDSR